jgi:putative transcriptional regulator
MACFGNRVAEAYLAIKFKLKEKIADVEFRERRVLMLKDIAEASGVHAVTLSKLANNKRYDVRVSTIDKLCAYFKCDVGDLLEYVPDKKK